MASTQKLEAVSAHPPAFSPNMANTHSDLVPTFAGFDTTSVRLGPLERYRPLSRLGRGGMAEVFLASWEVAPNVLRPVVIKRLHTHLSDDPCATQMFLDEARLACRLEHEHVVRTLEAGIIDGCCCIVMEYLEGQPLNRFLRRAYEQGKLSVEAAVFIADAVLDALGYAHDARDYQGNELHIVHRDVSPHNVFVTGEGLVKVLDFGIAKAAIHEGRTATGFIKGKIGYIAPEQALGTEVDRRTDVFATGVLLWEALTGTRLFKGDSEAATLNLTLQGEIPLASSLRPEVPAALDAIVQKALERNPKRRFPSAHAMRDSLRSVASTECLSYDARALCQLMTELFADELFEQRSHVTASLRKAETAPPSTSYRAPSSTSAMVLSAAVAVPDAGESFQRAVMDLRGGQRHWLRAGLVAAGFAFGALGVTLYRAMASLRTPAAAAATPIAAENQEAPGARAPSLAPPSTIASASLSQAAPTDDALGPPLVVAAPVDTAEPSPLGNPAHSPVQASANPPRGARAASKESKAQAAASSARDAAPSYGFLTIDSAPWSLVSIDGKAQGQTPLVGLKLPAGPHSLLLQNPELHREASYTVTIEPGETTARRIGLEQ